MTRQRLGWALVGLAGTLLLLQLIPGAFREHGASVTQASTQPAPSAAPLSIRRLAPGAQVLFIDRAGKGTDYELVGWGGEHLGSVHVPPGAAHSVGPWNPYVYSQSPSGAGFLVGRDLLGPDGRTVDLADFVQLDKLQAMIWRDDSRGACAVYGDSTASFVIQFAFTPTYTELTRTSLPVGFGIGDSPGSRVLACNASRQVAVVGWVNVDGGARLLVLDLARGTELLRRAYSEPVGSMVVSADGTLVALSSHLNPTGRLDTVVKDVTSGRDVLVLGSNSTIRAFSGDGRAVLVTTQLVHAPVRASIVRLDGGATIWSDRGGPRGPLVGWLVRPGTHDFALAFGPGKPQILEVVSGDSGLESHLGRGVGAWSYPAVLR